MLKYFHAATIALLFLFAQANEPVNAQSSPAVIDGLRATISKTVGVRPSAVEIVANDSVFTILIANSNMNRGTHAGRDNEANVIVRIVSRAIAESPEFQEIHTIRVQYVIRLKPGAAEKVVDAIEFRKSTDGSFKFHKT